MYTVHVHIATKNINNKNIVRRRLRRYTYFDYLGFFLNENTQYK